MTELEPISPRDALDLYLNDIDGELSPHTIQSRKGTLGFFVNWCEGADNGGEPRITNLNEISGRDFYRYKNWRDDDLAKPTLRRNLSDIRQFMKFCARIDAVPESIPEKIGVPVLEHGENERDTFMNYETATAIQRYVEQYQYASLNHALFTLLWQTGARMSGMHSLDVNDVDWGNEQVSFNHRPDNGTRLKNGQGGERIVTLPTEVMEILRDYADRNRIAVTDDHGRSPLFTTNHGRMSKSALARRLYRLTLPCEYANDCPSDRDPSDCEYAGSYQKSVECPHNTRPHDVRRGSITHWLKQDVPTRVVSDRMNVSQKTLERHYDQRTSQEKADLRRQYLDDVN